MIIWRRYGVPDAIEFPLIKRAVVDFAVSGDYTPVQSDVRIHIDAASASYATNLLQATGSHGWSLWMTGAEYSGKKISVTVVDAATKAVEDQMVLIETYGSPLAQHPFDFSTPTVTLSQPALDAAAAQIVNTVWATASRTLTALGTGMITADVLADSGASEIATSVWATASRTLSSFGTLQGDLVNAVWATPSRTLSATGATDIADALLNRNVSGGSSAGRTVKQAFHVLRNKVDARAGNVFDTDDTAVSWTFATTTDSDASRITIVDPA